MEPEKIRILILAANPWNTNRLDLGEEYQRLQDLWEHSNLQERFELRHYSALRGEALQEKVLKFKPHLIHFSGHGEADNLVFTDLTGDKAYEVSKSALAELFRLCAPDLKAVFLNACYSANQAKEIVEQVDYVIGINAAINDLAAISFSQGFYTAIFNQETLDIKKAFDTGRNQMAIAHITEAEQKKPVLQERRHTYVPSYQHDIFISFADDDTKWANDLIHYLHKQLKQKLFPADSFKLYSGNDFSQLEQAAMLLIISSPAYCQQYHAQFTQLGTQTKQQPVFLVEYDVCKPRPEFLKGFTPYKFWRYDDNEGMMSVTGDEYNNKAEELASAMAKRLRELKNEQHQQQRIDQQRKQQQDTIGSNAKSIDTFIFINSEEEDLDLIEDIKPLLEENGIGYFLPLVQTIETSSGDIRKDLESQIINCDALLILYEKNTQRWVRDQLSTCMRLQRKREEPLKVIAVYKNPDQPDIGRFPLKNLHIYCCTSEQITNYLSEFIKELAHE